MNKEGKFVLVDWEGTVVYGQLFDTEEEAQYEAISHNERVANDYFSMVEPEPAIWH